MNIKFCDVCLFCEKIIAFFSVIWQMVDVDFQIKWFE